MRHTTDDDQLELFDMVEQPAHARPPIPGMFHVRIRHDQAMIGGMAALIGVTVVFAMGVERGKQLVRGERALLSVREAPVAAGVSGSEQIREDVKSPALAPADARTPQGETIDSRQATPQPSTPKKKIRSRSRYAVQVVTYNRPQLARIELDRLQKEGEDAFLLTRGGQTVLYVGPFASKERARHKVTVLKRRYGDCFVRAL